MSHTKIFDTRNVLLVAGLALVWTAIGLDEWWLDETLAAKPPLALESEKIQEIGIEAGNTSILLRLRRSGWWLQEPIQIEADQRRIEHLLAMLAQPASPLKIDSKHIRLSSLTPEARSSFGLADQTIRLRFADKSLLIGGRSPVRDLRYASHNDRVFLLRTPSMHFTQQGVSAFVSPWPFAASGSIQKIRLGTGIAAAPTMTRTDLDVGVLGPWLSQLRAASVQDPSAELQPVLGSASASTARTVLQVDFAEDSRSFVIGRLGNLVVLRRRDISIDYYLSSRAGRELIERLDSVLAAGSVLQQ